jgi:enamine deaminase RidA (YjgF/YER057c/UK114 family)
LQQGAEALATVHNQVESNLFVTTLIRDPIREHFITITPYKRESSESLFRRTRDAICRTGGQVVSIEAMGMGPGDRKYGERMATTIDEGGPPVAWIESNSNDGLCGVNAWVVAGATVNRLRHDGRVVGSWFEDSCARYCRLAGLLPADASAAKESQTSDILGQMDTVLQSGRMQFSNVIRTWFYNADILSWYRPFNAARTRFFEARHVFDGLLPASTGIDGHNATGAALTAGVMAVEAKSLTAKASVVPSPLQSSATSYGSSFSRAVEWTTPDHRRLFISGTASIDSDGKTIFLGDTKRQIDKTLEVVGAILSSKGMRWEDVSRSIAYFKHAAEAPLLDTCLTIRGIPSFPTVRMASDICRGDLLFEIEVDALRAL